MRYDATSSLAGVGPRRLCSRRGFTLIELLVAALITAMIAGATTVAISQSLKAREASMARQEAMSRADAATARIADDVLNLARSGDLYDARVLLVDGRAGDVDHDELLLFVNSTRQARPVGEQAEGGAYEAQYRLMAPPWPDARAYILWRRVDPVPDEVADGGGIASPIVEGVASLSIEAFDGEAWQSEWDSDRDGYPHALRITATGRADERPVYTTARRVVAIDRTPIPFATTEQASEGASGAGGGGR